MNSSTGDVHGTLVQARNIETLNVLLARQEKEFVPPRLAEPHPKFVNRAEPRAVMAEELLAARSERRLARLLLHGAPGFGRLELANKWFAEESFPHGAMLIDFGGGVRDDAVHLDTAFRSGLVALGVPAAEIPALLSEKQALFRSHLATRQMLIVLRNVVSAAQAQSFVVSSPGSALVVLSSERLGRLLNDQFRPVPVTGLDEHHDVELFRSLVHDLSSSVDSATAESGVRACGGSPLLIHLLAAQVNDRPQRAGRILRRFAELGAPALGDKAAEEMRARLDTLCDTVPERVRTAYRALGLHPGTTLTTAAAAAAFGVPEEDAEELLDDLARYHLVRPVGDVHRIDGVVAWHARTLAARELSEEDSSCIALRIVEHHLDDTVALDSKLSARPRIGPKYAAKAVLAGHLERKAVLDRLEANRETLLGAVLLAEEHGLDEQTWQLCEALWGLYHLHGHHDDWRRTHEIGLKAAERLGDHRAIMRMASQLASAHVALGEHERADEYFAASHRAAGLVSGPEGRTGEQSALEWRGKISARLGDSARALRFYDESWEAAHRAPEAQRPRMFALLELHRARLHLGLERFEDCLRHEAAAAEYFDGTSESDNKAKLLLVRGRALAGLDRLQEAEAVLFAALDTFVADGSKRSQLDVLKPLVDITQRLGHKEITEKCRDALHRLTADLGLASTEPRT
ncbi:hypothetical protein [Allokutzneria oryzae]|uniref:Tetratricopeptide repeat protein n=1 Tax=Allokutzneria oryzae TaxID=1378989 RepID=A0ABV5ZQC7_9PSEU